MVYEHARVSHSEGEASSLLGCVENLAHQVALDIVDHHHSTIIVILKPKPGEWPPPGSRGLLTRDPEEERRRRRVAERDKRRQAREQGVCSYCRKQPARGGKTSCQACADKARERS